MAGLRQFEKFCERQLPCTEAENALAMIGYFDRTREPNRKARKPTSNPITPGIKRRIKELDADGLAQHVIAEMLGINQGRVNEVLKGRR